MAGDWKVGFFVLLVIAALTAVFTYAMGRADGARAMQAAQFAKETHQREIVAAVREALKEVRP